MIADLLGRGKGHLLEDVDVSKDLRLLFDVEFLADSAKFGEVEPWHMAKAGANGDEPALLDRGGKGHAVGGGLVDVLEVVVVPAVGGRGDADDLGRLEVVEHHLVAVGRGVVPLVDHDEVEGVGLPPLDAGKADLLPPDHLGFSLAAKSLNGGDDDRRPCLGLGLGLFDRRGDAHVGLEPPDRLRDEGVSVDEDQDAAVVLASERDEEGKDDGLSRAGRQVDQGTSDLAKRLQHRADACFLVVSRGDRDIGIEQRDSRHSSPVLDVFGLRGARHRV